MEEKKITIGVLARMVQKGFEETAKKEQVDNLEKWAKQRFDNINVEVKLIRRQLIDNILLKKIDLVGKVN